MFKVSIKDTINMVNDVVLMPLSLTLNTFSYSFIFVFNFENAMPVGASSYDKNSSMNQ